MSHVAATTEQQDRWFTNPWVWFVMFVPFTAVLFGAVMIISANYQPDDLVVDDYYKEGKGINRRIQQDVQAVQMGARASVLAVTSQGVLFEIVGGSEHLTLDMFHVTSKEKDLQIDLVRQSDTQYTASSAVLADRLNSTGIWYLEIRDEDSVWRLRQRINTPVEQLVMEPSP
ncbi:MAG: FixH family protein [Pseudomonadales bacterium]|jgi:hypothetical protein|nr:FixH family protein [Pseudomonadales bacterium]